MLNHRATRGFNPVGGLFGAMLLVLSLFALGALRLSAQTPVLPLSQWSNADIGTTPAAGSGSYAATTDTYTLTGSGADIWGTADNFHFSYQALSGDGVITARFKSLTNTNVWAKAGLMIRETLTPGSKYAMMMITPGSGTGLQYRAATSGGSVNVMTTGVVVPRWLRLERRGNVLSGYQSADGVTWVLSQRIALVMAADVYVGLAACSHVTTSTLTTVAVDQVVLDSTNAAMALPWPWAESAIGTSTDQGVALYDGSYVLSNLGADIWSPADKLKFVSKSLTGDGTLIIKVSSIASADGWTRLGLMMRESLDANAKNVLLSLTTSNGLVFQSRQTTAGATAFRSSSVAKTPPVWLKLDRVGNTFTAAYSADGVTWTTQGTETIAMTASIQVGVAYANRSTSTWAFGVGDQLKLSTPLDTDGNGLSDAWELQYFGHLGVSPSADADGDGLTNGQEWELGTHPTVATPSGQRPALSLIGGDNQTAATGSVLPQPLAVKVTDANTGEPLAGMLVTFQLASGQGAFGSDPTWQPTVSLVSDADGLVQTQFKLSSTGGIATARASIGNQPGVVTFTLKALLGSPGSAFLLDGSDIGTMTLPGRNQYQAGVYTLSAATGDMWNAADSCDYASQSLAGDGVVIARMASLTATDGWAKAGLMIRESLAANSRNIFIAVTPGNGVTFQWRDANGGACGFTNRTGLTAPKWLALRRSGSTIAGYYSDDGQTWTLLASHGFAATQPVYAGLAFSAHNTAAYGQVAFDSVSISPLTLAPWKVADIGALNQGNIDVFTPDTMLVRAGGNDVWDRVDNFRYVYQSLPSDGRVIVRVASQGSSDVWAKSGVMLRSSLDSNSPNLLLAVTPGNGLTLQWRSVPGATSANLASATGTAPVWLKLERFGSDATAYYSADGSIWTKAGSLSGMTGEMLLGLAASSHNSTLFNETLFDHVQTEIFSDSRGWSAEYFSNTGLSGPPTVRRRDSTLDFTWAAGQAPASGVAVTNYSARWQGDLQPATSDTYTFTALSTGGVRLWVDGQLVIDRWALQASASEVSGQVVLQAGTQPKVVVEYFNGADVGRIQLRWSNSTTSDALVPTGSVRPSDSDSDGIPDSWETAHGLNPLDASDAALTPDGDGLTNLLKYQAGLNPGQGVDKVPGVVVVEQWQGITGGAVASLTNNSRFPAQPSARWLLKDTLNIGPDIGDNYGLRIRGYLKAPVDGDYKFWIAGDDAAQLWLSPSESPFDRVRIAQAASHTDYQSFDQLFGQASQMITLQAGHYYYFEVLHKEAGDHDHVSVAWQIPGQSPALISTQYLASFAPRADDATGDGLPDAWKLAQGLDLTKPYEVNGAYGDLDGDGLSNLLEYQLGSNPAVPDTDGDGVADNLEFWTGSNPHDASILPTGTAPWTFTDVGVLTASGQAFGTASGGYLISSNGSGIQKNVIVDDSYRVLYQAVPGDFEFSAYVDGAGDTRGVGALVVRSSLEPQAASATLTLDMVGNCWFYVRPAAQATTVSLKRLNLADVNRTTSGHWLKLRRQGRVITSYYSADGQSWIHAETAELDLSGPCVVGMTAWDGTNNATWIFSHVGLRLDSNSDGAYDDQVTPDYQAIITGADPMPADVTVRTVAAYAGSAGVTSAGSWKVVDGAIVSQTPKSALDFDIELPAAGVYRLELEAQSSINKSVNVVFPVELSVDGQFLGRVEMILEDGQVSFGHVATPFLAAGTHRVHVFYDSTLSYRAIQINALRVQALDGVDSDTNGRSDWIDDRLALINTVGQQVTESFVSPANIEGSTRFISMMNVTAEGVSLTVNQAPGFGWYADVPLSPAGAVTVNASFENNAVVRSSQIAWKPINLLADNTGVFPTGVLRIRKGDSLRFTAFPAEATEGSATVSIATAGASPVTVDLASPQAVPVIHLFDTAGTYTVTGTYATGATGTLTVQVVEAVFNGNPTAGLGVVVPWDNPQIPTDVFLNVDQGLLLTPVPRSGGGQRFQLLTQNIGDSQVIARLGQGGPILNHAVVHSLRVASDDQTSDDVLVTYADGSMLIGTPIILSQVTPTTRVEVDIFVWGVTFDDGTIHKVFTAADFDSLGRLYVKFLYPAGMPHSFCHRISVYDGTTFLGGF